MSLEEDSISPIINFLHKLLGSNLWILPISFAIGSWSLFLHRPDIWWLLYIAIICTIIFVLHIFSIIYIKIKNAFKKKQDKLFAKEYAIKKELQEKAEAEQRKQKHANKIWKCVAHLDNDLISASMLFLQLNIHDDDKYLRYVKIPENSYGDEYKLFQCYIKIIESFTFYFESGYRIKLIEEEKINDIMYFKIDRYFYNLLYSFKETGVWRKIEYF